MKVAVITGSSASGLACMGNLLMKTVSSSKTAGATDLIVRGCFRRQGRAATARSSLPIEALEKRTRYEVRPYVDAADMDSLRKALEGVDRAMLVTPLDYREGIAEDANKSINMIQAAKEVGVKRIVHVGSWTVNVPDRLPILASRFLPTEEYLKNEIGDEMEWTVLRGGYFMSNFSHIHAESINTKHELLAVPDCTLPPVDTRDIGEAAAALLGGDHDENYQQKYHRTFVECCGPRVYNTHAEIAEEISAGVGRTISYPGSPALDKWANENRDNAIMLELYKYLADENSPGEIPSNSDQFAAILGREPTTLQEWTEDHRVLLGGKGY